jgi:Regulator of ribonuclease activity B
MGIAAIILSLATLRSLYPASMTMFQLLHQNAVSDTDLLRKNDGLGDIFNITREVDFALETGERQRADEFAEFVNRKSYGTVKVSKLADGRFRVLVLITMPITQHLIGCVSGFMLCLSRLFQIDYLGWGSVVQKP